MRLMKSSILIINNLGVGVNLFSNILNETDNFLTQNKNKGVTEVHMNLNWKSLIGFECVAVALNNPSLIKIFAQSALQVGKAVLVQIFESLIQATENLDLSSDINQKHMLNPHYSHQKTPKFIEAQILENELPPPTPSQIHKLIKNMILIFDQNGYKIGGNKGQKESKLSQKVPDTVQKQSMQDIDCKDLLLLSWKPLLMVLQNLLKLTNEESNIQMLLNSYQNFISVCGSVYCFEPRDGFLDSLCTFCLTEQVQTYRTSSQMAPQGKQDQTVRELVLTEKNIQICKTLLNIAHCLGYYLDVKSWYIILETMQKIENVIKNRQRSRAKASNAQQPLINQSGNQTLVDFNELRQKVQDKMREYNIVERFQIVGAQELRKKSSSHSTEEEEKKAGSFNPENAYDDKKDNNQLQQQQNRMSINAKRSSVIQQDPSSGKNQHKRVESLVQSQVGKQTQPLESMYTSSSKDKSLPQSQYDTASSYQQQQQQHHQPQPFDALTSDLQILQDSFDSLFTSSYMFEQQSLSELITSLGQLTVGVLEIMNNKKSSLQQSQQDKARGASTKHQPNEGDILANINTFAITRLVETALVNISRIELIWKILIAHFDILSNCKVHTLRQLSIEALLTIILEIFAFRKDHQNARARNPFNSPPKKSGAQQKMSIGSSGDDADQDMDFDVDENWSGTIWQYTILTPLSDQLKSQHQANSLQTLKGIEKIIQTCGQQLKNDGWRIIILTVSKTSESIDNDQIMATGFKCLRLIVNHYIDKLTQENFVTMLHAIHRYATNEGDNINNNLIAVGMYQNLADYIAKIIVKDQSQNEIDQEQQQHQQQQQWQTFNAQRIWSILFEKLQEIGNDHRAEIRRANIFTLENIIMTHGQLFTDSVWVTILKNSILGMLKNSIEMYFQQKAGPSQVNKMHVADVGLPTPSFSGGWDTKKKSGNLSSKAKKMNFDEDSVLKALQKNNDEQWEETCTHMIQMVLRGIKKYNQLQQRNSELLDYVWTNSVQMITEMVRNGSQEICSIVYKSLEDLLSQQNCVDLFMNNISTSFKILDATSDWLKQEKQESGSIVRKPNTLKLCPVIIETLKKIYSFENLQENQSVRAPYLQIIIPTYAQILMQLLLRMIKCSKSTSEGFQGMAVPHKLVNEERIVFEFIEGLNEILRKNDQTHLYFLKFLLQFTEYEVQEPHTEAFIRRTFSILSTIILKGKVANHILKEILPVLYDRIEHLINLRYNNDACMGLLFPSKGSQTLFYTVGLYGMQISSFLINPQHFKQRMVTYNKQSQEGGLKPSFQQNTAGSTGGGFTGLKQHKHQSSMGQSNQNSAAASTEDFITSTDIMFAEQLEFSTVDPSSIAQHHQDTELRSLVWEKVLPLARNHLLFNPERVAGHNKAVVEDVVKSSQDLDMQVMNFITNSLLPNCNDLNDQEFQQSLVQIIDNGCNSVYSSQRLSQGSGSQTSGAFGNSLSKYCLNNLFELCRYQQFQPIIGEHDQDEIVSDQSSQRKIYEIRRKIATITTPVLINRCRDTLKKYVTDEQKSGYTTLPRQRVSEAVFVLEKLRILDCYPEVQPIQYKSKKGHLVQMMPIFADLVLSNEAGLKDHLREIFIEISESISQSAKNTGMIRNEIEDEEEKVGDSSGGGF